MWLVYYCRKLPPPPHHLSLPQRFCGCLPTPTENAMPPLECHRWCPCWLPPAFPRMPSWELPLTSLVTGLVLCLQHGSPEAVWKVEKRRREALAPASPTDQLHSLLLKHQEGDLWPLQPADQDHFKRLLGLVPPLPEPVILTPPAHQPHQFGPGPGLQNGRPAKAGASPLMDNW